MGVRFLIPGPLQPFSGGRPAVALDVSPATIAEALAALGVAHPGLCERILTERGEVRPHVNVFVAETNIRDAGGLAARVPEGCEIAILPAVSGG
ncbi:MAG TPA: MoaD/ThiS family protein [Thermoanaerobaculia bacterium]|jgi:molybdopterin converting factor small subunit|nr:MoaD/ThiS family protein [Thermoanaerobaculia bacterium]